MEQISSCYHLLIGAIYMHSPQASLFLSLKVKKKKIACHVTEKQKIINSSVLKTCPVEENLLLESAVTGDTLIHLLLDLEHLPYKSQ